MARTVKPAFCARTASPRVTPVLSTPAVRLPLRCPGAIAGYRAALVDDPDYAYANTNLALILEGRGERAEAATLFRRALRARPDLALARQGLDRVGP